MMLEIVFFDNPLNFLKDSFRVKKKSWVKILAERFFRHFRLQCGREQVPGALKIDSALER